MCVCVRVCGWYSITLSQHGDSGASFDGRVRLGVVLYFQIHVRSMEYGTVCTYFACIRSTPGFQISVIKIKTRSPPLRHYVYN